MENTQGLKIACVTGGTGFRHVARELTRYTQRSSHIINVSDSGRSTRQLRLFFNMPAIGDLRSRLIDLADRNSPGYHEITGLLNHRLPDNAEATPGEQTAELQSIIYESHPLVQAVNASGAAPRGFLDIILTHLTGFDRARRKAEIDLGRNFDLEKGSIGNFFLAGAYLNYRRNLETAIFLYKVLANVQGEVVPATTDNVHLAARLEDGEVIVGQHLITKKGSPSPISELFYLDREDPAGERIRPRTNPHAAAALRDAEVLVFSMGSFFTSILSTLHLLGIAEAVRQSRALKVFIANPVEDRETGGLTAGQMSIKLLEILRSFDPHPSQVDGDYLNMTITGDQVGTPGCDTSGLGRETKIERAPLDAQGYYVPERLSEMLVEERIIHG